MSWEEFKPGVRVRYRYGGFSGTIIREYRGCGDWLVGWDGKQPLPAWELNLEVIHDSESSVPQPLPGENEPDRLN